MKAVTFSRIPFAMLTLVAAVALAISASAQTLRVIHSFARDPNGSLPSSGVIFDSAGNMYGVTGLQVGDAGSCYTGCGVAYKLMPTSSNGWRELSLFSFAPTGGAPRANLLLTLSGDLFGTGALNTTGGLAFELSPATKFTWQESVLGYSYFDMPGGALVADQDGNFYGVNATGGNCCGTVFELSPTGNGSWSETILYTFTGRTDGIAPMGSLLLDSAGNLYGTTETGGNIGNCGSGCGEVFELSKNSSGTWTKIVLHAFSGLDGWGPMGSLIMDTAGNLYGTTLFGGIYCQFVGCGTVFELSPTATGWQETVHSFQSTDGTYPSSGLFLDGSGNLYGITNQGGFKGCGVVFKLAPASGGSWTYTRLHSFTGGADGSENVEGEATPDMPLALGPDGNLYGVTPLGGANNAGTVFRIAP